MARILLIDGNSILNRAFYGIMGNKMLMTEDGTYTNAVYGFLSILFKVEEELAPEYIVVAFDKKGPTKRHEMYKEYKANRKGMPEELAMQMPIIKEILIAMNIKIIEKDGYEGDDIIGTLSRFGEKNGLDVTILSGDRDNFQLATDKITIEIPRTKAGKTETDYYDRNKVIEEYGVEPYQLIQVKGLMGDTSDNIPGVPGVGEKTALQLIKDYIDIDKLYEALEQGTDSIKGKLREKLVENKDLAFLSRELGRINIDSPIEENLYEMKKEEWDKEKVLELFKKYRFNRYIERFSLQGENTNTKEEMNFEIKEINSKQEIEQLTVNIKKDKKMCYKLVLNDETSNNYIISKKIIGISICIENIVYYYEFEDKQEEFIKIFKDIFEDKEISLIGYELSHDYILLKQIGITPNNLTFDVKIAAYLLNPVSSKYPLDGLSMSYADIDIADYLQKNGVEEEKEQLNLFETAEPKDSKKKQESIISAYAISKLQVALE